MGLFGRRRREAELALAEARSECQRVAERLAAAGAERDAARSEVETLRSETETLRSQVEKLRTESEEHRRLLSSARTAAAAEDTSTSWPLLLADLERRWAEGVGAGPSARGVEPGPVAAQLAQGLGREIERLREEVGVDVSLTTGEPIEPANPVVFLLAATGMLGALAARCERVTVALDGDLVLTGEDWSELGDDLETARTRALAAGTLVDPIDVADQRVRITLHPKA